MRIILTAPDTGRKYKLEPLDNGLCYQIFVTPLKGTISAKTGKKIKSEWTFTGSYPSTIEHGIKMMIEKMLSDPHGKSDIECDPKHLTKIFKKKMDEYIEQVISSIDTKE